MINVDNNYGVPRDVFYGECMLQVIGREDILIENYKCIKEITENNIEISCRKYNVCIKGKKLFIKFYNNESMIIGGDFNEISFL